MSYAQYQQGHAGQLCLRASDFAQGPVRLHRPVVAVLLEDVVFDPEPARPTAAQIAENQALRLGFFAAANSSSLNTCNKIHTQQRV